MIDIRKMRKSMKESDLLHFLYERSQVPLYKELGLVECFLEESFWEPVISSEKNYQETENYFQNIDKNITFIVPKEGLNK